jgi:Mn-dependent DtxR family transcriptional regulator
MLIESKIISSILILLAIFKYFIALSYIMDITKKERDYLIAIDEFNSKFQPRLVDLAKKMRVRPPTVYNLVRRLSKKGLVDEHRGMIKVTERGRAAYKSIIMAHRCIETLLSKAGVQKDCACKEACKIDYMLDPTYVKLLFKFLGSPKVCPHGKPIIIE